MDPNQAQDKEVTAKDAKGGWIAAIAILLIAIGAIAGVIVGTNNELAKKDDEIANLKKAAEAPSTGQSGEPTTPAKTEPSLAGFDTKIVDAFKLLNGDNSYLAFEKMAVSKDGKYMFIIGKEKSRAAAAGLPNTTALHPRMGPGNTTPAATAFQAATISTANVSKSPKLTPTNSV